MLFSNSTPLPDKAMERIGTRLIVLCNVRQVCSVRILHFEYWQVMIIPSCRPVRPLLHCSSVLSTIVFVCPITFGGASAHWYTIHWSSRRPTFTQLAGEGCIVPTCLPSGWITPSTTDMLGSRPAGCCFTIRHQIQCDTVSRTCLLEGQCRMATVLDAQCAQLRIL